MARYLCVHCDQRFDSDDGKPRCPKCMRVHGIEKLSEGKKGDKPKETPKWVMPVVVVAILGGAIGGWAWWAQKAPDSVSGEPPIAPLSPTQRAGYLRQASVSE